MLLNAKRGQVWVATIEDRPGGLADKLESLAKAQVNLDFLIARRHSKAPGAGVAYVAPIEGERQVSTALDAGFKPRETLFTVRAQGPDEIGMAYRVTRAIGAAGINMHGISAARVGDRCVLYLAFEADKDADEAARIINSL